MIEARQLTKRYGTPTAVDDLSSTVRPGVVTGFLGPNCAGKSTTMRMIIGLDRPTSGTVTVNGARFDEHPMPLHEVGALLEAKAVHTGRSARIHLRSLAAAQALISGTRPGFSLSDTGVLRIVIGTGGYLTLVGLLGAALGWIVRSTPGALVSYFAIVLVIPVVFGNVLGTWGKDVSHYLPSEAGRSFVSSFAEPGALHPWPGLLVLMLWVVALTAGASVRLRRHDA